MKRLIFQPVVLFSPVYVVLVCPHAFAGNIDNQTNYSAEWLRALNRNASTDSADAAAYNPGGTMGLRDGFYINVTGQCVFKDYWHKMNGVQYESDTLSGIAPVNSIGLDFEETDDAWGAIFGLNSFTKEGLNIGLRYETKISLDLTTEAQKDDLSLVTPTLISLHGRDSFKRAA